MGISAQNIWIYYVELRQIASSENLGYLSEFVPNKFISVRTYNISQHLDLQYFTRFELVYFYSV